MIELIISAIVGLGLGVGSTLTIKAIQKKHEKPIILEPVVIKDESREIEAETVKQLTDIDLTLELCKTDENKNLCREIICYQFATQKGVATEKQCESISNINNKIILYEYCKTQEDFNNCIDIFWRRN